MFQVPFGVIYGRFRVDMIIGCIYIYILWLCLQIGDPYCGCSYGRDYYFGLCFLETPISWVQHIRLIMLQAGSIQLFRRIR